MSEDDTKRQQLAENMRFYADMRFKQLTLLVAWLTLAGGGVAQFDKVDLISNALNVRQVLSLAAVVFTGVMWTMEVRATLYWRANRDAAPDLLPRPRDDMWAWLNATYAVLFLHVAIYFFWLWLAYAWSVNTWMVGACSLLGVVLVIFSVYEYRQSSSGRVI